ncbi:unnamed protein product [Rotaria socialis]|uniref:Uncharacterized protein n=1 Tax=Rotaria socialis TaxID=392032 RepID=A0A821FBE2_9BILA|nr:unnamed protein product [Rotaria socialis]
MALRGTQKDYSNMFDENMQNIRIIWLDRTFCYVDASQRTKLRLHHITSLLKTFAEVKECFDYIRYMFDDVQYIFLIISVDAFENVDSVIEEATQLMQITFLYLITSENNNKILSKEKIRAVCNNENRLLVKLTEDVALCNSTNFKFNISIASRSTKDLTRQSAKFMWYQYLVEILVAVPEISKAKDDLLEFCRSNYAENRTELDKILEFEKTYNSEFAIKWYTRDSFLYRLINKVLRQEDVDDMYKIRLILSDIHTQLVELHGDFLSRLLELNFFPYCLTTYRGQFMSARELDQLKGNIGRFISTNSFLSTTSDRDLSLIFSGQGQQRPQLESTLFEITIETNACETAFADIGHISWMQSENEILITLGAIFHIDSVNEDDNVWIIKLTLCNQKSEGIEQLTDYFPDIKDDAPDLFTFVKFLSSTGDYVRATEVCRRLISSTSPTDTRMPMLWNLLAKCLCYQGYQNLPEIMNYYNQGLELIPTEASSYPMHIDMLIRVADSLVNKLKYKEVMPIVNQIETLIKQDIEERGFQNEHIMQIGHVTMIAGMVCDIIGDYSNACEHFQFVENLYFKYLPVEYERLGDILFHKSLAQSGSKGDTIESLEAMQQALKLHIASLPPNHPAIAADYNIIAWIYLRHYDIANAQKALEKSIEVQLNAAFQSPIHLGNTYMGLGSLLPGDDGMSYLDKAHELFKLHLLPNDRQFIQLYISMAENRMEKNEIEQARVYLTGALKIELQPNQPKQGKGLAAIYVLFGVSYLYEENYKTAIDYLQKSINLIKGLDPHARMDVLLAYNFLKLANVYQQQNDLELALSYYKQSLDIYYQVPLISKLRLARLHNHIATVLVLQESFEEAFAHFQKTLEYQLQSLSFESEQLLSTYKNLGMVSKFLKDDFHFLEYYQKALDLIYLTNSDGILEAYFIHNEIGTFWELKGEYTYALESYELALKVNRQFFSENHPSFITNYNTLALIYSEIGEYEKAIEYFQKAFALDEQKECSVPILLNIGMVYLDMEQCEKAEVYFEEVLYLTVQSAYAQDENKTNQLLYITALDCLARTKGRQKHYEEAQKLCKTAFILRSDDLLAKAVSFVTFGSLLNDQGDFDGAVVFFHRAEMTLKTLDANHPALAKIYAFRTGSTYYNKKEFGKALSYYEMALDLTVAVAPGNKRQIKQTKYGIDRIMDHILEVNQSIQLTYYEKPKTFMGGFKWNIICFFKARH